MLIRGGGTSSLCARESLCAQVYSTYCTNVCTHQQAPVHSGKDGTQLEDEELYLSRREVRKLWSPVSVALDDSTPLPLLALPEALCVPRVPLSRQSRALAVGQREARAGGGPCQAVAAASDTDMNGNRGQPFTLDHSLRFCAGLWHSSTAISCTTLSCSRAKHIALWLGCCMSLLPRLAGLALSHLAAVWV